MKKLRYELKSESKDLLQERWLIEGIISLVVSTIGGLLPLLLISLSTFIGPIIGRVLLIPLGFGFTRRFIQLNRGEEPVIEDLFFYYQLDYLPDILMISLLASLITGLLSILLIIPGVIAYCHFGLYKYVLYDYPSLSTREVFVQSSRMMKGHKIDFLLLQLSFIGWYILGIVTVIGIVPLKIYKEATFANFYNRIQEDFDEDSSGPTRTQKVPKESDSPKNTIKGQIRIV